MKLNAAGATPCYASLPPEPAVTCSQYPRIRASSRRGGQITLSSAPRRRDDESSATVKRGCPQTGFAEDPLWRWSAVSGYRCLRHPGNLNPPTCIAADPVCDWEFLGRMKQVGFQRNFTLNGILWRGQRAAESRFLGNSLGNPRYGHDCKFTPDCQARN